MLLAAISAVVSIATAILAFLASRDARAARADSSSALTTGQEVQQSLSAVSKGIDGVREQLVASAEGKGRAEGMLIGQQIASAAGSTAAPAPPPET